MSTTRGFTIIEALTALAVGAAVLVLAVAIAVGAHHAFRGATATRDAAVAAHRALDLLVREIRSAQTGRDGSYPIITANDRELVISSDVDGDGDAERVRYALAGADDASGGTLERSVTEANGAPPQYDPASVRTTVLARGIRNGSRPLFTYYNAEHPKDAVRNPLPTPSRLSDTRYIRITLEVNLDPRATATTTAYSGVALRNLREQP